MGHIDTTTRTSKPTSQDKRHPLGRTALLNGLYRGFIKDTADVQRNGRLHVWIPELGAAPDNKAGWVIVNYCSPYAGATNVDSISRTDTHSFESTQTSYGFWMIPPDINNEVLVAFVNGDPAQGYWIGCAYNQYMNNMVPTPPSTTNNWEYPGKNVPVAEYNKWDPSVHQPNNATKPFSKTKFEGISNQGLIKDPYRGTTTTSARRESPSNVFGFSTPGPIIDSTQPANKIRRMGGSSLVMDDGKNSEYIQLSTKSGAQIRLDETNGFVYIINRDGTGWIEITPDGNIDVFAATDISLRAQRDFNIRADRNINIEAGQDIYIKAAGDTSEGSASFTYDINNTKNTKTITTYDYVGEGNGSGGNIVFQATNDLHSTVDGDMYLTVTGGNLEISVDSSFALTTVTGGQDFNSDTGIKMTTGASLDIAANGNIRTSSNGTISVTGSGGIILCTENDLSLKAANNIKEAAGSDILLESMNFGVTADTLFSNTVGVVGIINTQGGLNAGGEVNLGANVNVSYPPSANPPMADAAVSAITADPAEIKATIEKINILPNWIPTVTYPSWQKNVAYNSGTIVSVNNIIYITNSAGAPASETFNSSYWTIFIPDDKFKRAVQSFQTTLTRLPTYEPCPEHATFTYASITGYTPKQTSGEQTYQGSGGLGNPNSSIPVADTSAGANNKIIGTPDPADSALTKDFNMAAYECQLKINEGVKYVSYNDTKGLPTAGIGHLLRSNEIAQYPVPTNVPAEQVSAWFQGDALKSIAGAQRLLGIDTWGNLSDIRKRACADLCYNMGEGGLGKFKQFLAYMKSNEFNNAGNALKDSGWFRQVGQRGPRIVSMIVNNQDPCGCDKKS